MKKKHKKPSAYDKVPCILICDAGKWRKWLEKNHLKKNKVGIILYKKHTGKPFITQREAMDEGICFGWIDTLIKRLDDKKFIRYFVRRGDKAMWSENTLRRAKCLLKAGRMSPVGILRYKEGLRKEKKR